MNSSNCNKIRIKSSKSMVSIHKSVLFESEKFNYYNEILDYTNEAFNLSSAKIKLPSIDINIFPNQEWLIMPEFGFGAITYSPNLIHVSVDTKNFKKSVAKSDFGAMIAHEFNHTVRLNKFPVTDWNNMSFLEDAIQEGIAIVFQEQIYPNSSLYINPEIHSNIEIWLSRAKDLFALKRSEYNHSEWFYGGQNIPRWAGYTLGYYLAKNYYESNDISLQELTDLPAEKFV